MLIADLTEILPMAVVDVYIQADLFAGLLKPETDVKTLLKEIIKPENEAYPVIERILREYHFNDGGSPYIEGFEITAAEYNAATRSGKIWFTYRIDYYFGCEDRSAGTTFTESYNFETGSETGLLKIHFPPLPLRDTVDEF